MALVFLINIVMVQVMVCRLFGTKPSPEPMPIYCQLDPYDQISIEFQAKLDKLERPFWEYPPPPPPPPPPPQ